MKFFQLHPKVNCCACRHGVLHDKDAVYPETEWAEGDALDKMKSGFLVEVEPPEDSVVQDNDEKLDMPGDFRQLKKKK